MSERTSRDGAGGPGSRSTDAAAPLRGYSPDLASLGGSTVLSGDFDVARIREKSRRRRLWHVFVWLLPAALFVYYRVLTDNPLRPGFPNLMFTEWLMIAFIGVVAMGTIVMFVGGGRSPAVRYDPSEITVGLSDVVGLGPLKEEVIKSLNLFLGYQTFRDVMGGNPRRGVLFEGPPGTGKTYMAKAMAREANVPCSCRRPRSSRTSTV
jgi:hypothetical protein